MMKEKEKLLRKLLMFIDMLTVLVSFFLGYLLRNNVHVIYIFDFFPERQVMGELFDLSAYLNIVP